MGANTDMVLVANYGRRPIERLPIAKVSPSARRALNRILHGHGTVLSEEICEQLCEWAKDDLGREAIHALIEVELGKHIGKGCWLSVEFPRYG